MTNIAINGEKFTTDTDWVVNAVTVSFTDTLGGDTTFGASAYNPDGPNAGDDNLADASVVEWSDELISIDFDGSAYDPYVRAIHLYNEDETEQLTFDLIPDQSTAFPPNVNGMDSPNSGQVRCVGDSLLMCDNIDIGWLPNGSGDFQQFFNPAGPNAGLQPPGVTIISWTDTIITIGYAAFSGETITHCNVYSIDDYVHTYDGPNFPVT